MSPISHETIRNLGACGESYWVHVGDRRWYRYQALGMSLVTLNFHFFIGVSLVNLNFPGVMFRNVVCDDVDASYGARYP